MPLRWSNTQERGRTMNTTEQVIPGEQWLPIPGYEGFYEVSDHGRVRRIKRRVRGGFLDQVRYTNPSTDRYGYLYVHLKFPIEKNFKVATAVALAFLGPRPSGFHVCHNDGNRTNNLLSNLRYDSPQNNMLDRKIHGTQLKGTGSVTAKLTESDVLYIRGEGSNDSYCDLMSRFGVNASTIWSVRKHKTWTHI